ncbi:MAG: cytochrome c oxidase subunit II [Acidobacteriaceae bacterium]
MNRPNSLPLMILGVAALIPRLAAARYFFNFQNPVTPIAVETMHVHDVFLEIVVTLFLLVLSIIIYSLIRHRHSRNHVPSQFTGPRTKLGWVMVTIPFLALTFIDYVILGIPAYHSVIAQANTRGGAKMVVRVIGSQWKWQYEYPDLGISYLSRLSTPKDQIANEAPKNPHFLLQVNHPLVLPINEKVRILLTSDDVLHSWWIPAFGIKQDVVPGFVRETWVNIDRPGIYRGQCAELCGIGHAFMPIVVDAKTPQDFARWVAMEQKTQSQLAVAQKARLSEPALLARGKTVFQNNCAVCHQANGEGVPGAFPPIAAGHPFTAAPDMLKPLRTRGFFKGGVITLGPVPEHIGIVLNGIKHTPMPAFAGQLSDADIAAVITYERNSFGNHSHDVVQPAAVAAVRATNP